MTFSRGSRMERGRVSVGGSGGGRGGKVALGGIGGVVVLVVALLLGGDPGELLSQLGGVDGSSQGGSGESGTLEGCETEVDANSKVDCRIGFTVSSLDTVWQSQLAAQTGVAYVRPAVNIFTDSTFTGCGSATSAVGPFYCPADATAYFDTSFFRVLVDQFGSSGGPLAQEYVVAHEVGHHIQNQLGDIGRAQSDPQGPESGGVRVELQADCYAGIWAHFATQIPAEETGVPFLDPLSEADVDDALSAAASVGDDRIQQSTTGQVNPEGWTHGSSAQRQSWFLTGYRTGSVSACDTFAAVDLNNPAALTR